MNDKSSIEVLREILDKIGVKHTDIDTESARHTYWPRKNGYVQRVTQLKGSVWLTTCYLTPEQAIAATVDTDKVTEDSIDKWLREFQSAHGELNRVSSDELKELAFALHNDAPLGYEASMRLGKWLLNAAQNCEINGNTSDGYHTFNELYHHRAILFSVIVANHREIAWKSKLHHGGTMYDNMFIVGIDTPWGQASYHYDIDPYWDMFDCEELERAPEWDGHTPDDAIERIGKLATLGSSWLKSKNSLLKNEDTQEKLREDVCVRFGDGLVRSIVMRLLDRQRAITKQECEQVFLDRADAVITRREIKERELRNENDRLKIERDTWRAKAEEK